VPSSETPEVRAVACDAGIPTQTGEGGRGEQPEFADFAETASGGHYPNELRSLGTASVSLYRHERGLWVTASVSLYGNEQDRW
jgi:hypothetical protein